MTDPLDDLTSPSLKEQLAPYRAFTSDPELAITLLHFEKKFGGPGLPRSPCDAGASFTCPECNEVVRAVTAPSRDKVLVCPLCERCPGALVIGMGILEDEHA